MRIVAIVAEAAIALFILFIFGTMMLPALAEATGQSMGLYAFSLFLLAIGVVASVVAAIFKMR